MSHNLYNNLSAARSALDWEDHCMVMELASHTPQCPLCGSLVGRRGLGHLQESHGVSGHQWLSLKLQKLNEDGSKSAWVVCVTCMCGQEFKSSKEMWSHLHYNAKQCYTAYLMRKE